MAVDFAENAIQNQTGFRVELRIPRNWQEGAQAAALIIVTVVCRELGFDPNIGIVVYESLSDGSLDQSDCAAIGGVTGAAVLGAVMQAVGVPFPIGAFIGGMIGSAVGNLIGDEFQIGKTDRDIFREQNRKLCMAMRKMQLSYSSTANQLIDQYYQEFEANRLMLERAWSSMEQNPTVGPFQLRYFRRKTQAELDEQARARGFAAAGSMVGAGRHANVIAIQGIGMNAAAAANMQRLQAQTQAQGFAAGAAAVTGRPNFACQSMFGTCASDNGCLYKPITTTELYPTMAAPYDRVTGAILCRLGGEFPFKCPVCTQNEAEIGITDLRIDYVRHHEPSFDEQGEPLHDAGWLAVHCPHGATSQGCGVTVEDWRAWELAKLEAYKQSMINGPEVCTSSALGPPIACPTNSSHGYTELDFCVNELAYLKVIRDVQVQTARLRTAVAQVQADLLRTAVAVASKKYAHDHAAEIATHGAIVAAHDTTTTIGGAPVFAEADANGNIIDFKQRQSILKWRTSGAPVVKNLLLVGGVTLLGYALWRRFGR
jgi:gas vesicle protein